ncbi:MAG TPA: ABC transporter substrate-binding protein [Stellaceae bacterium]|nr:ABC transporter substrate-binding protein [Stellaceae bacterium]
MGFLASTDQIFFEGFRRGLRDLGRIDGVNITVDYRFGGGSDEALPLLARQLVESRADVIVAPSSVATAAAMQATSTIPIVMVLAGDPVGSKFIASLSRPGGNVTGTSQMFPEVSSKQLELLKNVAPTLSRVVVLWNPLNLGAMRSLEALRSAARTLRVQLLTVEIRAPDDLDSAFSAAAKLAPEGVLILSDPIMGAHRSDVVDYAQSLKRPTIVPTKEFVRDGGLMAYAPDYTDLCYRAAAYVDKILKGAKPADLPVEQPTKFELAINLKTAKALGLEIPPSLLARADEVIE